MRLGTIAVSSTLWRIGCQSQRRRQRSEETGELLAIGINSGETVVYGKFAGTEITIDGQDLLIVSAGDMLATVGDAPQS